MPRSFRRLATLVVLVLFAPSPARGQYITARRDNNPFAGKPAPMAPVSVAKAIIERDKDMNLSDSQRTRLVEIQRELDSAAAPLLRKLDSLRPTWRPAGGANDLSPEQREQITANWNARSAVVEQLTPVFAKARERVMSVLDQKQQERAAKLEKEARKRAEDAARRELDSRQVMERRPRRGQMRDATGSAPLG